MIDIEVRNNIEQTAQRFAQQGLDVKSTFTPELVKSLAESTRPQAEKNVQRNLALKALAEKENITIDKSEIDLKMKEYEDAISQSSQQIDIKIEALLDALTNELVAEIPKSMIDIEVRNNIEQTAQRFAQQGLDVKSTFTPELVKSLAESTRPQAEKNVQRNLALKALAEKENIKVEQDEIDSKMKDYEDAISQSSKQIDIKRLTEVVSNDLLKEKLIIWLEENSEVKEKTTKTSKATKTSKPSKAAKTETKTTKTTGTTKTRNKKEKK